MRAISNRRLGKLLLVFRWCLSAFFLWEINLVNAGVDYVREVKPILRDHCLRCHGPLKAKGKLRLDTRAFVLKGGKDGPALVAGNAEKSLLLQNITSENEEERMPPEGKRLSEKQIEILKNWIATGAKGVADEKAYDPGKHWAFQILKRPAVPKVGGEWGGNPIDGFVARKHSTAKVKPRPVAPRHVLLRRVYLDLIGLPPTREELQAFLADKSPGAYSKVVDRLLASPHYGERWGRHWMDVWRYSDWYGFQGTARFSQKNMWHFRDWIVESLNADKGYGQMITEMLAADELLPFDAANLRATGFLVRNRNTDSREQWIRDTVDHTSKSLLGLTVGCAQCHDHPYDPVWHEEYYRFRNIFEPVGVNIDNAQGWPQGSETRGVPRIFDQKSGAKTKYYINGDDKTPDANRTITPGVPQIFSVWAPPESVSLPPIGRIPLLRKPVRDQTLKNLQNNITRAHQEAAAAERWRALAAKGAVPEPKGSVVLEDDFKKANAKWQTGPGQWSFEGGRLSQADVEGPDSKWLKTVQNLPDNFSLTARFKIISGEKELAAGFTFETVEGGGGGEGIYLSGSKETPGLRFILEIGGERHPRADLRRALPIKTGVEHQLRFDVRGKLVNVYVNGALQQSYKGHDFAGRQLRLWTLNAKAEFTHLRVVALPATVPMAPADSVKNYLPVVKPGKPSAAEQTAFADAVLGQAKLKVDLEKARLESHRLAVAAEEWKYLHTPAADDKAAVDKHKARLDELAKAAQKVQRMESVVRAKDEVFQSEQKWKVAKALAAAGKKGDEKLEKAVTDAAKNIEEKKKVLTAAEKKITEPLTPSYSGLSSSYGGSSGRRLALARWMTDANNPLTARVAANHIWLRHFDRALVTSVFDFGLEGQKPSHPELLDWLACELRELTMIPSSGGWTAGKSEAGVWSMKHLHKLIVTSRAYRMASTPDEKNLAADSDNLWLWRMTPRRMEAEVVRDCVLHAAGGLDPKLGGPDLPGADGMASSRRSIYFHHSPSSQMDFLKVFDGADPTEAYQRHTSIVPHQALALFNSELTLVQSRNLARKLAAANADDAKFVQAAHEQILARTPKANELALCVEFLKTQAGALKGQNPRLRAREKLVHALFNHHEFVTIR